MLDRARCKARDGRRDAELREARIDSGLRRRLVDCGARVDRGDAVHLHGGTAGGTLILDEGWNCGFNSAMSVITPT